MSYSIFPSANGLLFPPLATSPSFLVASQPHPTKFSVCPMSGSRSTSPAIGYFASTEQRLIIFTVSDSLLTYCSNYCSAIP